MRVGVAILPEHRWRTGRRYWETAESLGFAHAWTYDHLTWRAFQDSDWLSTMPTLAAAACVTQRIRLGTMVASPNFRHPVLFAKEIIALDDLSDGRFTLGVGAGGTGFDATALGGQPLTPRARADRFEEFTTLLDRLLTEDAVEEHTGEYYQAVRARSLPGCLQRPRVPFAVAATGPRGLRLAARQGQAWITYGDPRLPDLPENSTARLTAIRDQLARLDKECELAGRDPAGLDRILLATSTTENPLASVTAFEDFAGRYAEIGITDLVVHWPRPEGLYAGSERVLEQVASEVLPRL